MTNETPEVTEHRGDLRDGMVSCSCGWKPKAPDPLLPAEATRAFTDHLEIPWDGDEGWQTTMASDHMFFMAAHERAYGALLGELKDQPGKGRIRTMLNNLRRDGELTSQQPPYSEAAPIAPDSSESEQTKEEGTE